MSTATAEIVRLWEALPEDKRVEVMDFARFLLDRAQHPDDLAWEERLGGYRAASEAGSFSCGISG